MKVEGDFLFNGPREEVWEIVRDPEVLATALPGTKSLNQVGENEFEGEMNVRVGPVAGLFAGRLIVSNEVPPERCTLSVEGKGNSGFVNGIGNIILSDQGDGTTMMKYEGDAQVGGRLASVGQRLLDTASKSMIRQGLEALNLALLARMASKSDGGNIEFTPPSESKFAAAVAKDISKEMLSSPVVRVVIAILVILVIAAVIWLSTNPGG